jgi:hypothetical protein
MTDQIAPKTRKAKAEPTAPVEPTQPVKPNTITVRPIHGNSAHLLTGVALIHNRPTEVANDSFTQAQVEAGKWAVC